MLTFSTGGGAIVLIYKLLLIVPLTQIIAAMLARAFGDGDGDESEAAEVAAVAEV